MIDDAIITRDPRICGGEPVIRGTRVTLRTILASLADGDRFEDLLRVFPTLTEDDLWAVVRHAAAAAQRALPTRKAPPI